MVASSKKTLVTPGIMTTAPPYAVAFGATTDAAIMMAVTIISRPPFERRTLFAAAMLCVVVMVIAATKAVLTKQHVRLCLLSAATVLVLADAFTCACDIAVVTAVFMGAVVACNAWPQSLVGALSLVGCSIAVLVMHQSALTVASVVLSVFVCFILKWDAIMFIVE